MTTNTHELRISAPIKPVYDLLRKDVLGWKIKEADSKNYTLKWKKSGSWLRMTATCKPLSSNETVVSFIYENPVAIADPLGRGDEELRRFLEPIGVGLISPEDVHRKILDGLLCPTCAKELSAGTRFCPNDGTPIARECPNCKRSNAPGSQFCSNCGAKI